MSEGRKELHLKKIQKIIAEQPLKYLKDISLLISYETPLEIVSWLFSHYKSADIAATHLETARISLDKGCGSFNNDDTNNPTHGPSLVEDFVPAISPAQSLAYITELSLSLTRDGTIPETAIISFLEASGRLRTLSIDHGQNVDYSSIVRALPPTVESFKYTLTLDHENIASFDDDFSLSLTTPSFRAAHPPLRSITLSIIEEFKVVLAILHETNPRSLEWIDPEEQKQAIRALPNPMLSHTREACLHTNVRLSYSYGRSGVSLEYGGDDTRMYRQPNGQRFFVMPISPVTIQL
jgi:hypothetical protein